MALAGSILSNNSTRPHQSLARRLLFPNHTGDLPPLLATPDAPPELQAELYDFIALALRAYVNPWWTKITRYDKDFLPQTARIVASVVRALEARVLAVDLPTLCFQDVPAILTQHYRDYRNAESKLSSSYAAGGAASLPQLFHHLQPHIALSTDGRIDLEYYRQIVDHILKACLPPEDYAPEAERVIVREVIVKVLVEDAIPKITQPWFIQRTILDLLGDTSEERLFKAPELPAQSPSNSFSFHTFIVLVLSALQSFSSTCLALINAYKQAISTIKRVNQSPTHTPRPASPLPLPLPLPEYTTAHNEIQRSASTQSQHSRIPSRTQSISTTPSSTSSASYPSRSAPQSRQTPTILVQPDLNLNLGPKQGPQYENFISQPLTLFSEVFLTSERLAATTIMTLLAMISASMTPFLDKLLPHILYSTLSPGFILNLVRLSKRTMFPNGYPGPPPIDPTSDEQVAIRQRLVEWRGNGTLSHLFSLLLGVDPTRTINAAIDPLTSQPCNVHLTVILIDRILVGLFPELIGGNSITGSPVPPTNTIFQPHANADIGSAGENANTVTNNNRSSGSISATGGNGTGGGGNTFSNGTSGLRGGERSSASSPGPVGPFVPVGNSSGGGGADDS
ncbi:hypothetical protein D9756_003954 [Leucocoprinus leucothites]|uniref:PXA domain-containing protein n=1 Tax=Leucocoprinus leucothites TaxID=201217 RepID=A0A8H5D8S0_9AGAR|nr:hypothetical protein D9756_003954 [Leucoagaricus leucothites]